MPRPRGSRPEVIGARVDIPDKDWRAARDDEAHEVARLLLIAAEYLDELMVPVSGVCRRAARMLGSMPVTPPGPTCRKCGAPLPKQQGAGRPREFCSRRCRGS